MSMSVLFVSPVRHNSPNTGICAPLSHASPEVHGVNFVSTFVSLLIVLVGFLEINIKSR